MNSSVMNLHCLDSTSFKH